MVYILATLVASLLFISFYLTGEDLFAPANVLTGTFLISILCAIYNIPVWHFEIGAYTLFLIFISLLISVLCNACCHKVYKNKQIRIGYGSSKKITPISYPFLILFLFFNLVCVIWQYKAIKAVGSDSFAALMHIYRQATAYGNGSIDVNPVSSTMSTISTSIAYITLFNLIYNFKDIRNRYKLLNLTIILLWIILYFLQGTRFDVFSMPIAAIILINLKKVHENGQYQKLSILQLLKIVVALLVLLYVFYIIKDLVGRRSDQTIMEYLTSYLGGSIPLLDSYIKEPTNDLEIFGQETFYSLNNGLIRRGFIDFPLYSYNKEFRSIQGIDIGNVYTALRDYYHDFGLVGMIILHTFFSAFFSWFYEKQKIRGSYFGILILSRLYYCVAFYMFSNSFFARIISLSFLKEFIFIWLFYTVLVEKKVKLESGTIKWRI